MSKNYLILSILLLFSIHTFSQKVKKTYISPEIAPYCEFIEQCNTDPIDYIMELFTQYDVVILGERDHRDTTQYELIDKLISDPRFIAEVGNILTEVGSSNNTEWANRVVTTDWETDSIFTQELLHLWQHMDYEVFWEKYNFYLLLSSIYRANQKLPLSQKINLYFTDIPYSWDLIQTKAERDKYIYTKPGNLRECSLAINSINYLLQIFKKDRKKALIIYNLPHAVKGENMAGGIIQQLLPGKVANVMLNWSDWTKKEPGEDYPLFFQGKWDAAFAACGNKSIGFNLSNTVFGRDSVCCPGHTTEKYMENALTGYIFYKPYTEWSVVSDCKITDDFIPELYRRCKIVWPEHSAKELKYDIEWYTWPREVRKLYNKKNSKYPREQINKYYRP